MADTPADIERLRWQCRRGLLELDHLLEAFLEREYPRADVAGRAAFVALLRCEDPNLQRWLLGDQRPADPALAALVARMRAMRL